MAANIGPNIPTNGLEFHADFSNLECYSGVGSSCKDLSKNSQDGSLTNSPSYVSTNLPFLTLNGTTQNVFFTMSSYTIAGNASWSISFWGNINSVQAAAGTTWWIFWQGPNSQTTNQLISLGLNNNVLRVAHWGNDFNYTNCSIDYNAWAMYTCTYDGTTERVYKNGIFVQSRTPGTLAAVPGNWTIYARGGGGGSGITGSISMLSVYNRSISDEEVLRFYNATKTRIYT